MMSLPKSLFLPLIIATRLNCTYSENCEARLCPSCDIIRVCDHCEKEFCSHCSVECDDCDKVYCDACNDEHEEGIETCDFACGTYQCDKNWGCGSTCCFDCRVRSRMDSCFGCSAIVAPALVSKVNKLQRSNKRLKRKAAQREG